MANYSIYIDFSGGLNPDGYFEIEPVSIQPFTTEAVDSMLTMRKVWGEVQVKNMPYKYANLGGDKYKLYDIIKSCKPSQEIHIKFVSSLETIEGYFGLIDTKLNDDEKVLTIKVTTLDQYTDFLENREKEIELFKEDNVIVNGNFADGVNNAPDSWSFDGWEKSTEFLFLQKKYVNDKSVIAISDYGRDDRGDWDAYNNDPHLEDGIGTLGYTYFCIYAGTFNGVEYNVNDRITYDGSQWVKNGITDAPEALTESYISQTVNNIIKNKQVKLYFEYGLEGLQSSSKKFNLSYSITLYDATNPLIRYGLNSSGNWTQLTEFNVAPVIVYKSNAAQIPSGSVELKPYKLTINRTPIAGNIKIEFYRYQSTTWEENVKLYLTKVQLATSALPLKTIKVAFSGENLVAVPLEHEDLYWKGKLDDESYFTRVPSDQRTIDDYFTESGNPHDTDTCYLNDKSYGITSANNLNLLAIESFFKDKNSRGYGFELSEYTVYKGHFRSGNKRNWYLTAKFSREQKYTMDTLLEDGTWQQNPPADGVKWESLSVEDHRRLWVRPPFGGIECEWTITQDVQSEFRKYDNKFEYTESWTTKKNYPISANSTIEIESGIDLRDCIKKLYQSTHPSLLGKQVYSTFFWNDAQSESITNFLNIRSGINYVTDSPNELNNIAVIHTSQLATQIVDDDKRIIKISPKKFLDDLMVLFPQIYWWIDEQKNLHIEHIKLYDASNSVVSLLEPEFSYIKNYHSWEYIKDKMYGLEEYNMKNSGYPDFKNSTISFDKIVSNKRGEDTKGVFSTQNISTDILYCYENKDSLDNGLILVGYSDIDGVNTVVQGIGQKSAKSLLNGQLSLATLLSKYATYEGTWYDGMINDKVAHFDYTKRSRQGKEIVVKGILLNQQILTDLGKGIARATFDYDRQNTKITAIYRHEDKVIVVSDDEQIETNPDSPIVATLPTVITNPVTNITETSGTCGGTVTSEGGASVTESGIVYGGYVNPTIENDTKIPVGSGLNTFTGTMYDLEPDTLYKVRAYAINSVGVSYGAMKKFKTNPITEEM